MSDRVTSLGWSLRLVSRLASGLFLAWFIAISVLATASAATVGAMADTARLRAAIASERTCEAEQSASSAAALPSLSAEGNTSEPTPTDDGCADPMAPPGDDIPPELELDLENEPWILCTTVQVPPVAGTRHTFAFTDHSHQAHVPEATSPPPRA